MKHLLKLLGYPAAALAGAAVSLLLAGGCVTDEEDEVATPEPTAWEQQQSDLPRDLSPSPPAADLAALVAGNNAFAYDLYAQLRSAQGNLFCSPFSISSALAMTYAGARAQTEQQMAATLHFTLPQDRLHPAFNALDLALAARGQGASGTAGRPFRLTISNALWGQQGYHFETPFLDVLAVSYGAGMRLLDFAADPELARGVINQWVSDETEAKIPELLQSGDITAATRVVLTNAIYFNAKWKSPFGSDKTAQKSFELKTGEPISTDTMSQIAMFDHYQADGLDAVELPYEGDELSMLIIAPPAGQLAAFEDSLDSAVIDGIVGSLSSELLDLELPKLSFSSRFRLEETLAAMGMEDAFSPGAADFSGMTGNKDLFLSRVIHEAFVAITEEGTEATAATAVVGEYGMPVPVHIDRPFIFVIRDLATSTTLFVGRLLDPR